MSDGNRDLEGDCRCPFKRTSRCFSEETEEINVNNSGNVLRFNILCQMKFGTFQITGLITGSSVSLSCLCLFSVVYLLYFFTYLKFPPFPSVAGGFKALIRCRNSDIKVIICNG